MAENIGHIKSIKFGGTPVKEYPEPNHSGTKADERCNDYGLSPTIKPARKMDGSINGIAWDDKELKTIKRFYEGEFENISLFGLLPYRSKAAIRHKTSRLGYRYFRWEALRKYNELTNEECAYIAGILDGEGSIGIVNPKPFRQICITVSNTNENLVNWLKEKLGGGVTGAKKKSHYRICYRWYLHRYINCVNLLKKVYPYLIVKKDKAKEIV